MASLFMTSQFMASQFRSSGEGGVDLVADRDDDHDPKDGLRGIERIINIQRLRRCVSLTT